MRHTLKTNNMYRFDIINHLIKENNYKSYLEIGYYKGWSFYKVKCEWKDAVDPNPCMVPEEQDAIYGQIFRATGGDEEYSFIHKMTSDNFFAKISDNVKYDIIFIDGLHESSQVDKDIQNTLKHLSVGGTIVMHDCNPSTEEMATTGVPATGEWCGDVYKSFINFTTGGKCNYYVVDTDYGVGVIKDYVGLPQSAKLDYNWDNFDKNRKELLNLISPEEFLKRESK